MVDIFKSCGETKTFLKENCPPISKTPSEQQFSPRLWFHLETFSYAFLIQVSRPGFPEVGVDSLSLDGRATSSTWCLLDTMWLLRPKGHKIGQKDIKVE